MQLPVDAPTTLRVGLVDSRDDRRKVMRHVVEGFGTRAAVVGEAGSREGALLLVDKEKADVVVLDIRMPVAEGLLTVRDLHRSFPALGIVVCSFDLDRATADQALSEGVHTCLAKPASGPALLAALEAARPSDSLGADSMATASAGPAPQPE